MSGDRILEAAAPARLPMPQAEFIALMALLTSMTAMSIDIMLPALPEIAATFSIAGPNDRQLVVVVYLAGLAVGQLLWGPLSDRIGRRPPLLAGLALFIAATLAATAATSFAMLLAARLVQGVGGAAARAISTAVIRDLFAGRRMASMLSTVMMVFIIVPIVAPSIGQAVMALGGWRAPFHVLLLAGSIAGLWAALRLPETRDTGGPSFTLANALRLVLGTPVTRTYGAAAALYFGCLVAYISSAQQVFGEIYGMGPSFPLVFGGIAVAIALANFTNARLVQRLGMRRLSHAALTAFLGVSLLLSAICAAGRPPVEIAISLLAVCFYLFGLIQANFNAIAMQPVGQAAGTASALLGFATTATGAVLGGTIARQLADNPLPLALGFAILSACALLCVVAVEGRAGMYRGE